MGEVKRQTHSAKFKAKLGLEAVRGVKTVNQIAQEHRVHPVQVSQWNQSLELGTQCLHQFTQRNGIELVLGHESPRLRMLAGIRTQSGEVRTSDEGTYSSVTSLPLGEGTNTTRRLRLSPPLTEVRT